jgi:hypothetical protein
MFIGHYAVSFALKKVDDNISLGVLFLAVQFVDILFFPFVLMGIEHFDIIENYTESTHFHLTFMPYTHSFFAALFWASAVYFFIKLIPRKATLVQKKVATVMAIAVLSHWFLDLIVHTPDLPLLSDHSIKFGFGLWNNAIATYLLEAALLMAGIGVYLKSTKATSLVGKYGVIVFGVLMLVINANNIFGPPFGNDTVTMSASALAMYFVFAGVAFWLDGKRI